MSAIFILSIVLLLSASVNGQCGDSRTFSLSSLRNISVPSGSLRAYSRLFTFPAGCDNYFVDTVTIAGRIASPTSPASHPFDVVIYGGNQSYVTHGSFSVSGPANGNVSSFTSTVSRASGALALRANVQYKLIILDSGANNVWNWFGAPSTNSTDQYIQFPNIAPPNWLSQNWFNSADEIPFSFTFVPAAPSPGNLN